ncbi:MAG: hypothetical protein ACREUF_02230 [Solimonas sp.]
MNWADVQYGEQQGARREGAARARDNRANAQAIDQWEAYSNRLKAQLDSATTKEVFGQASLDAQTAMLRRLEAELRRLDPNNPLLREENQRQVKAQVMADTLAKHGYRYDTKTYQVSKIR